MKIFILLVIFIQIIFANNKFIFEASIDKTSSYYGEVLELTYIFKSDKNINIVERNFTPPDFENFYIHDKEKFDVYEDERYTISKIKYFIYPRVEGNITIPSALMDIVTAKKKNIGTYRFEDAIYNSIESNEINIEIKKIPNNLKYIGNFSFKATIDKNQTTQNTPVNLTIYIKGDGNFNDIEPFKLSIKDSTIYTNLPIITKNSFTQTFAIISAKDYQLNPITFKYFDTKDKRIKELKSSSYHVKVKNKKQIDLTSKKTNYSFLILSFLLGVILTIFVFNSKKKKIHNINQPLIDKLKDAKNLKDILNILLPLSENKKILNIIKSIEKSIYKKQEYKITKKEIIEEVKIIFTND